MYCVSGMLYVIKIVASYCSLISLWWASRTSHFSLNDKFLLVKRVVAVRWLFQGLFSPGEPEDPSAQPHGGEALPVSAPWVPQGFQQLQWQSQTPAHTPGHSEWALRSGHHVRNGYFRAWTFHVGLWPYRSRTRARCPAVQSATRTPAPWGNTWSLILLKRDSYGRR